MHKHACSLTQTFYISLPPDIPFETEDQLRERGTSKTPDVLLSTPVAVQVKRSTGNSTTENDEDDDGWRIVCWIDSKVRVSPLIYINTNIRLTPHLHR
jgi:Protein of unknown function TPD sequence-motif